MKTHKVLVVHNGHTYAVTLLFNFVDDKLVVSVLYVERVTIFGTPYNK